MPATAIDLVEQACDAITIRSGGLNACTRRARAATTIAIARIAGIAEELVNEVKRKDGVRTRCQGRNTAGVHPRKPLQRFGIALMAIPSQSFEVDEGLFLSSCRRIGRSSEVGTWATAGYEVIFERCSRPTPKMSRSFMHLRDHHDGSKW